MLLASNILNKKGCIWPHPPKVSRYSHTMDIQKLQRLVIDALEDVKAQDIKVFNTTHITSMFDRVIIASGTSNRQTRALASSVADSARKCNVPILPSEGPDTGEWFLVHFGDFVVHCFHPSIFLFYTLYYFL